MWYYSFHVCYRIGEEIVFIIQGTIKFKLGFDLLMTFICLKVNLQINSGFLVKKKKLGEWTLLKIFFSPNVTSYMCARLEHRFFLFHITEPGGVY